MCFKFALKDFDAFNDFKAIWKAIQILDPIDVKLDLWTCDRLHFTTGNFICELDLNVLAWFLMTKSWRYFGAGPLMHLNLRTAILYVILSSIFNQCRLLRYGVMCNTYLFMHTIQAAEFWILYSLAMLYLVEPNIRLLQ